MNNHIKHLLITLILFVAAFAAGAQMDYVLQDEDVLMHNGYIVQSYYNFEANAGGTNLSIPDTLQNQAVIGIMGGGWSIAGRFSGCNIRSLVLPEGFKDIGDWAFSFNRIASVVLPSTLVRMGEAAFNGNEVSLVNGRESRGIFYARNSDGSNDSSRIVSYGGAALEVDFIPEEVTVIDSWAFGQIQLRTIALPAELDCVCHGAFSQNLLDSLVLPDNLRYIGQNAFSNNRLSKISIPASVTYLGFGAFAANLLEQLHLNEGELLQIEPRCFAYNSLRELRIPGRVQSIGYEAFYENQLSSLMLSPGHLRSIGDRAFMDNQIDSLLLPGSLCWIGAGAFEGNKLSSLQFSGNKPDSIGDRAFMHNQLKYVQLPADLISLGSRAFMHNELGDVSLPGNLQQLGGGAFNANRLCLLKGQPFDGLFYAPRPDGSIDSTVLVSYGAEAVDMNIIPEGVREFAAYALASSKLSSLRLPAQLQSIGDYACSNNLILNELHIPATVSHIGEFAFFDNGISSVLFDSPAQLSFLGKYAFYNNFFELLVLPDHSQLSSFTGWYDENNSLVEGPPFVVSNLKISYLAPGLNAENAPSAGSLENCPIYYNPQTQSILLHLPPSLNLKRLSLFSADGSCLELNPQADRAIDLSSFPPGCYLLRLETEGGVQRLVKILR